MKRWIICILALLLVTAAACSKEAEPETTTLLIYMVGSDLEAKAGAASKDLEEIAASGVDLTCNNVLVYAGGTPNWHNDAASAQQHRILQLTQEGFVTIAATEPRSMGDSYCLTNFLNYAWEVFPADHFALILWDHGDGPVIGYGRDMLYDNDTLTLKEMETALANSAFATEGKLDWVGFDACMMASAELSCTWAPYASYLAASQEVEPNFGWDYSFLSQLGKVDAPALLQLAAQTYLSTCQAYYESRGYGQRDTTLSCVDLSCAGKLEESINALFARADQGIGSQYNELVVRRVQTRALGRTTTGSEYDLIDLRDLAIQLQDLYPEEAAALIQVLDTMVLTNVTNTTGCCGLSLYYPFYNKSYYTGSWSQAYGELGLFPQYQSYLQSYQSVWLGSDFLNTVAASQVPVDTAGSYTLQLTPQQQEVFASARYYILIRDGEELYTRAFTSENVTNNSGLLTANFEGNVIYVRNRFGKYHIPVIKEHETVGDETHYSAYVKLANGTGLAVGREDMDWTVEDHRICLTLNNVTGEITIDGVIPCDFETQQDTLAGGKLEEGNLQDWPVCYFVNGEHRYLTRNENRTILGLESWAREGSFSASYMSVEDGFEFVYMPLTEGDYYLMFEIEDTQGNRYCSELLPIEAEGQVPQMPEKTPVEKKFTSGSRIELYRDQGVTVELLAGMIDSNEVSGYRLEVTNENDFPVMVYAQNLCWGEDIYCGGGTSVQAEAGQKVRSDAVIDFGTAGQWDPDLQRLEMSFELFIVNPITWQTLLDTQPYHIRLGRETLVLPGEDPWSTVDLPYRDAMAEEQVLLETPEARVTLLTLGANSNYGADILRGVVCIENLGQEPLSMTLSGVVLNGVYADVAAYWPAVPAGSKSYQDFYTYGSTADTLDAAGVDSVATLTLLLQQNDYSPIFTGNTGAQLHWCPVTLSQSGTAGSFPEGELVLMDQGGIRITLLEEGWYNSTAYCYTLSIVNSTQEAVYIDTVDPDSLNSTIIWDDAVPYASVAHGELGPNQSRITTLTVYHCGGEPTTVSFRFRVRDYLRDAILFYSEDPVTVTTPVREDTALTEPAAPPVQTLGQRLKTCVGATGSLLMESIQAAGKLVNSAMPVYEDGVCTLQLTPSQQECFAGATCYVLCREGETVYAPYVSGIAAELTGGVLTARFDGKLLLAGEQGYTLYPAGYTIEQTADGQTLYSTIGLFFGTDAASGESISVHGKIYLRADSETGKVRVERITVYDKSQEQEKLVDGQPVALDMEQWQECIFVLPDGYLMARNADGTLPGLQDWTASSRFGYWEADLSQGLEFACSAPTTKEYYLIFEIEDTQGNRYCSEPVQLPPEEAETPEEPKIKTLEFLEGDRVKLYDQKGVTVSLVTSYDSFLGWGYKLEVTNRSDTEVNVTLEDLIWGGDIYCGYMTSLSSVPPERTVQSSRFDFGYACDFVQGTDRQEITFTLEVGTQKQTLRVKLSQETLMLPASKDWYDLQQPALEAKAGEQVLLETPQLRVTLLGLGGDGSTDSFNVLNGALCVENRTDQPLTLSMEGNVINGVYIDTGLNWWSLPAGCRQYRYWSITQPDLEYTGITSAETVSLLLRTNNQPDSADESTDTWYLCPVALEQAGTAGTFPESGRVLMNQNGIRITLLKEEGDDYYYTWTMSVVNTTGEAIAIQPVHPDYVKDSSNSITEPYLRALDNQLGPGQSCVMTVSVSNWETAAGPVEFRFLVTDFLGESIAFCSDDVITLHIPEKEE